MNQARRIIQELGGSHRGTFTAHVQAVGADTVDVIPVDGGPPVYDVRLRATLDGTDAGVIMFPTVGSVVVCAWLDAQNAAVVQYSDLDRIQAKLAGLEVQATPQALEVTAGQTKAVYAPGGVEISAGGQSLGSILQDLLTALQTLTVTCAAPGSPSSPPVNVAAFTALKTRVQALLN